MSVDEGVGVRGGQVLIGKVVFGGVEGRRCHGADFCA